MAFSFVAILVLASPVPVACATSTFWHTVKDYDSQPLLHGKATFRQPPENYFNRLPASSVNTTRRECATRLCGLGVYCCVCGTFRLLRKYGLVRDF